MDTRPLSSPTAFLSDVHGNLPALEAVLRELSSRAVSGIYVAGDLLLGGREPLAVWQRLERIGARAVAGPSDVALARVAPAALRPADAGEKAAAAAFEETRRALGDVVVRKLGALPYRLRLPLLDGREVLLVHGSPADPFEALSHELDDDALGALLADDAADIVVCGGSHVPFVRNVDGIEIVNVGSVGAAPEGAFAHYTILSPRVSGADVEQLWIEYDPREF